MRLKASVIICTYNPRGDYLARVLGALRAQTLTTDVWELLLIDNASTDPLTPRTDLSWHPRARAIREDELGLTPARLRGIREATGETIIFVDDDNVLEPEYLAIALEVGDRNPALGAWGGAIFGEFETAVPEDVRPHVGILAIKDVKEPVWSNQIRLISSHPSGAGMCVRRSVAIHYADAVAGSEGRRLLDRKGNKGLASAGDLDLAFASRELGLGWGVFPELRLAHLMPAGRLDRDYLKRLQYGGTRSWNVLLHELGLPVDRPDSRARQIYTVMRSRLRSRGFDAEMYLAHQRGLRDWAGDPNAPAKY